MASITVKENGKNVTLTYTKGLAVTPITLSNGKKLSITGSTAASAIQALYAKTYPDVKVEPPVVIPPTVPQQPDTKVRAISMDELTKSAGLNGENLILNKGNYNGEYFFKNLRNSRLALTGSVFGAKESNAVQLVGDCSGLELFEGLFKETRGKCINYEIEDDVHVKGLKLTDISFDSISQEIFDGYGWIDKSGVLGILEGFEMSGCKVTNSPDAGTLIRAMAVENFKILNNTFQNVCSNVKLHNGMCLLQGNGEISGNAITDYEGSFVRMAPCQVASSGKMLTIKNNIFARSKGYSALEFQVMNQALIDSGRYKPADVLIQRNTAGLLSHVIENWASLLVDLYELGNTVTLKDNLLFETFNNGITGTMVHYVNATKATKAIEDSTNKYFAKWQDAVADLTSFKSLHPGIGAV